MSDVVEVIEQVEIIEVDETHVEVVEVGIQGPPGPPGPPGEGGGGGGLVTSVAGKQGVVTLDKADVGLGMVDNTSDTSKPVSTAQQTALDAKLSTSGGTVNGSVHLQSSAAGGPDGTDTTSRLTVESHQTNGDNNFGEGIRMDLMNPVAKNMIAWRMQVPKFANEPFIMGPDNRGFETDVSGWSVIGSGSLSTSGAQHASGSLSARLLMGAGTAGSQGISNTVTGLTVGRTYTLHAFVFVASGAPSMVADVSGLATSSPSTAVGAWRELTVDFVATSTSHTIRVLTNGTSTAGQVVFIDQTYVTPEFKPNRQAIFWAGAHSEDQAMRGPHNHWSVEAPDKNGYLQTRFEVKFADKDNLFGVDKTVVMTHNADLVVDAANGQQLRIFSGAGTAKYIQFGNEYWGTLPRWLIGQNNDTETGTGNAGSNFEFRRYNDLGVHQGTPIIIQRSNGRTVVGGLDGSQSGLTVNRSSSGAANIVNTTANAGIALEHNANDTTSKVFDAQITGDTVRRFTSYVDGRIEWGTGSASRDTNLYRSAANALSTDDKFIAALGLDAGSNRITNVAAGSASTDAVNKAQLEAAVANLLNSAPAALDTLYELAGALGNDPNFATTMSTALGLKAPLASPAFTGTPTGITKAHVGLGNADDTADLAKPISTATQTALNGKQGLDDRLNSIAGNISGRGFMVQNTDTTSTRRTIVAGSSKITVTNGNAVSANPTIDLGTVTKSDVGLANVDNTSNATERAATRTLTNARVTRRTGTNTSSATPTINTDNVDFYSLTAQAADITSFTLSGTPTEAQTLWIAITGTAARGISWGTAFEASTVPLPTTTVSTNRLDVGFIYNSVTAKWRCVATC